MKNPDVAEAGLGRVCYHDSMNFDILNVDFGVLAMNVDSRLYTIACMRDHGLLRPSAPDGEAFSDLKGGSRNSPSLKQITAPAETLLITC